MPFRVAVLVSGEGTNLQALLDTVHGHDDIEIVAVAANRPDARGLERARAAGVETAVFAAADYAAPTSARTRADSPRTRSEDSADEVTDAEAAGPTAPPSPRDARDRALGDWLEQRGVDLLVLAGFMEILSRHFIRRFAGRIINVHPSLLPAFPGVRAIEQALAYGVKVIGVTVHLVDEGVDTGPIVLQEAIECPYSRNIAEAEQRIHEVEHRLLPRAVRLFAEGRVRVDREHPRVVIVDDGR